MIEINLEKQLPAVKMNFEEFKFSLLEAVSKYDGIIVTEENLKDCKIMQKELASLRIKFDNYRKEIKVEMQGPIIAFEEQCKEIIKIITAKEIPFKDGFAIFDDKKRDANRKIAEDIIFSAIIEHELNEKYARQLNVLEKYCNLTAKATEVKNDIDSRCYLLLQEQEQEIETLQIISDTIESLNKGIDAKISIKDFQMLIDLKASPVKIMQEIQGRAWRIRVSELKAKAEKAVEERIAKDEEVALIVDVELNEESVKKVEEVVEKFKEQLCSVKIEVRASLNKIKALRDFLKSNSYDYTVLERLTLLEVE